MNELHPTEQRLIAICRRLGFGTIERVGIKNGLPVSVQLVAQRLELDREEEGKAIDEGTQEILSDLESGLK